MNGEIGIDIHSLPRVKSTAGEKLVCNTGTLRPAMVWGVRQGRGGELKREGLYVYLWLNRAFLVAQTVKNLLAMQKTHVRFLGHEDPLEKELATHSSILLWRIPWTKEPGRL